MSQANPPAGAAIHPAVAHGDLATVKRLLDQGVPIDARDPDEWTPLHVAVACGQIEIIALLLQRGADVNAKHKLGSVPLLLACNKPLARAVELLVAAGADPNVRAADQTFPLLIAAMFGQLAVARALLSAGARIDDADGQGRTALIAAADAGQADMVRLLIGKGAAIEARSARGATALHFAATRGQVAAMTALLDGGASVDARDQNQQTPLMTAVLCRPEAAALLLGRFASANARADAGLTPLHVAARQGHTTTARLLLDHGAEVDVRNDEGGTPLYSAAVHVRKDVMDLLVSRGASLDAATPAGATPRNSFGAAKGVGLGAVVFVPRDPVAAPIDAAHAIAEFFAKRLRGISFARALAEHDRWRRLARRAEPAAPIIAPDGKPIMLLFTSDDLVARYRAAAKWLPADVEVQPARGAEVLAALPADLEVLGVDHRLDDAAHSIHYGRPQLDLLRRVGRAVLLERALAATPLSPAAGALAASTASYIVPLWGKLGFTAGGPAGGAWIGPTASKSGLMAVVAENGRVLLPIHTLDDAADRFESKTAVLWASEGKGMSHGENTVIGSKIFGLANLPVDGAIVNPYGPGPSRILSLEECDWIVSAGSS